MATACLVLFLAEGILLILSWILSTTMGSGVRSLLSSEGIRWFFGSYTAMLASPLLVKVLLVLIAYGCARTSGVARLFPPHAPQFTYRERMALRAAWVFLTLYLVIVALLTLPPHAILLSATGELFPSAFSRSLVPIAVFGVTTFSIVYGIMSWRLRSLSDILHSLTYGIQQGAPLLLFCVLFIQFYESLRFVFG